MAAEELLKPGEAVGPYRIQAKVGRGGMGDVYKAVEPALDRTVALKVMGAAFASDSSFVDRFKTEAKAAASLVHPNIVNVFTVGEHKGQPFIAMEFVDGESLQQRILREKRLPPSTAIKIAANAARGLEAAWKKGVVHRDIKPANLMIGSDGAVKVADFGLAKLQKNDVSLTQTGIAVGTPLYMSPEQGRGEKLDHRTDQYSLGATLYHALSGKPPFEADTPLAVISKHALTPLQPLHTLRPDIPEVLSSLVTRMMAKAPADRFPSYDSLIKDLERVVKAVPAASSAPAARSGDPAAGFASTDDAKFGKVAVKSGMITEAQLKGALALQEKHKAAGKPARTLAEILVAAKVITPDQREILANSGLQEAWQESTEQDESSGSHSALEMTEVQRRKQAESGEVKGPICACCKLEVRPEQVQTVCNECGARQHAECYTSFGGCGNERCAKSPRSIVPKKGDDDGYRANVTWRDRMHGLTWPVIGLVATLAIAAIVWKSTYKSAKDLYEEAKALEGGKGGGKLTIFSLDEGQKMTQEGTSGPTAEDMRRLETQISLYRQALEKEEKFVEARYEMAQCMMKLNRKDDALKEFEKVLTFNPGHQESLLGAGALHLKGGNTAKAQAYLQQAAKLGVSEAHLHLGVYYQDFAKDPAQAVSSFRNYLGKTPDNGEAWARLAAALFDMGNDMEAMTAADNAAQKGATSPMSHLVRAKVAFKGGRFEEAGAEALQAVEKSGSGGPLLFEAHKVAGRAYVKAGKPDLGRVSLETAKSLNHTDVDVLVGLAELYVLVGNWGGSASNYQEAFDRSATKNFDHLLFSGQFHLKSPGGGSSAAVFEKLQRLKPDYPDVRLWLARAYLTAKTMESAVPAVAKAIEEKPEDPDRNSLKIWILRLEGRNEDAIALADEWIAKHPNNVSVHVQLAEAAKAVRRMDRAVSSWRSAAENGDIDSWYYLGEHYFTQGDKKNAQECLGKFLEKVVAGDVANNARNFLNRMSTGTGHVGPTFSNWQPVLDKVLGTYKMTLESKHETVDMVYFCMLASTVMANSLTESYKEIADMSGDVAYSAADIDVGLSRYANSDDKIKADMRVRRIREKFDAMAIKSDRFLMALAAWAKKVNPACSSGVDAVVTAWPAKAPKDPFDKVNLMLAEGVRILGLARGDAARDILSRADAQLVVAENKIQECVAHAYALCELAAQGTPAAQQVFDTLQEADSNVGTGLGQLHVGLRTLAQILEAHRKK